MSGGHLLAADHLVPRRAEDLNSVLYLYHNFQCLVLNLGVTDHPPAATTTPSLGHGRKKRVTAACDFCRRRKLGCDNVSPSCGNCRARNTNCIYAARVQKARPSNLRIRDLESEIERLTRNDHQFDRRRHSPAPVAHDGSVVSTMTQCHPNSATPSAVGVCAKRYHATAPENQVSATRNHIMNAIESNRFHGETGSVFDGRHSYLGPHRDHHSQDSPTIRSALLAEGTRQRQLETVNLKSGILDFDGVEPNDGMKLLSIYWNRQYHIGPIVYRPAFMRDMARNGPRFSKLLLNAMYFSSAEVISRASDAASSETFATQCKATDECSEGMRFRRCAEALLYDPGTQLLCQSSLVTAQALLIMSHTLFSWCDEKSASWHYAGLAISMLIDLGVHTKRDQSPSAFSDIDTEELEIYRRVYWSAYAIDKLQSVYQGRPVRLRESEHSVPILFLDEYDELDPFHSIGYAANSEQLGCSSYAVSTFAQMCKLSVIIEHLICSLYIESSAQQNASEILQLSRQIEGELSVWRGSLPPHTSTVDLPHTTSLLSLYNAVVILLHRPLVSDSHLQAAGEDTASEAFNKCISAATTIDSLLVQYRGSFCIKSAPYPISYAAYVSATIHLRVAAQQRAGSEAHRHLYTCVSMLREHARLSHASRKCLEILNSLIRKFNVDASEQTQVPGVRVPQAVQDVVGDGDQPYPLDPVVSASVVIPDIGGTGVAFTPEETLADIDMDEIFKTFAWDSAAGMDGAEETADGLRFGGNLAEDVYPRFDALFGVDL